MSTRVLPAGDRGLLVEVDDLDTVLATLDQDERSNVLFTVNAMVQRIASPRRVNTRPHQRRLRKLSSSPSSMNSATSETGCTSSQNTRVSIGNITTPNACRPPAIAPSCLPSEARP